LNAYRICPCCFGPSASIGFIDLGESCNDAFEERRMFRDTGISIQYWGCRACGHIWTADLDAWVAEDFRRYIYNEDYILADPPFAYDRPARNAALVESLVRSMKASLDILDWGGGDGLFARMLRDREVRSALSCDAFYGDPEIPGDWTFPLVTCFEVVEHVPDQRGLFSTLARHVDQDGALLFSTLTQPADIGALGLRWWYARPRNGHIRLHSRTSLELCLSQAGLAMASLSAELHVGYRTMESPLVRALLDGCVAPPSLPPGLSTRPPKHASMAKGNPSWNQLSSGATV
jgi:hypothetical protein